MTEWYIALPATIVLIALSAFFVIIEFALLAARRHRLEETAETSAASRAALRSLNELTLMLAGAQLGITACTFALGAITKPWVHDAMMPMFTALGLPYTAADVVSFVLALFVVTFIHLVIGEMAPKSWAITHPDTALRFIAIPARGFIAIFRPLLTWINRVANRLVVKAGEEPVDRAAARGYDYETLNLLVQHSRETGALDSASAAQITGVIELERETVGAVVTAPRTLPRDATVAVVQRAALKSGDLRVLLDAGPSVVHVRDTLRAAPEAPAAQFSRPALTLPAQTSISDALEQMRMRNEQVVVVTDDADSSVVRGVLTWDHVLNQLWPSIAAELDRVQAERE
ncbi:hemolysin family protein [Corynebacterium sanguinis]|uniref:CNNM domain-containing protein n=1 Tax=Corynebacterium sanguinis TaxID=2594913 RepID=UPI00223A88FA|nr:hemolysin family protein [Corynebacterium sanguinis]MCT1414832.1 hemolysin family protein [Corynebacterium sanguinis]MCT1464556.1 hemolysin family protein [Corynebacterium sanguinis]MCT1585542.1 hemolysin family protein [Corynebacterium sanguinis]MCT2024112.1 hemolysin family protein [Corynebacterium sanguinis]MCT2047795.1 hemolysin family protein [Corynebacterium sanguinis]